jgi:hypothetical protein
LRRSKEGGLRAAPRVHGPAHLSDSSPGSARSLILSAEEAAAGRADHVYAASAAL